MSELSPLTDLSDPKPLDIEVVNQFGDQRWRLHNLYYIVNDQGQEIKFVPNWMQERFWAEMWYRNDILKCRQLGFCLDESSTYVLMADLRWRLIGDLTVGSELVAVDEHGAPGPSRAADRKMRTATVEGVRRVRRPSYRLVLEDDRSVICSSKHPWLSRSSDCNLDWRSVENESKKKLRVGSEVRWVSRRWADPSLEDYWVGGMLDGEGSLGLSGSVQLGVSQIAGPVLDRFRSYLCSRGYHFYEDTDESRPARPSKFGKRPVHKLTVGRMDEIFRLIGQCRPTRFVGNRWWEGRELPGKKSGIGWSKIVEIEPLGTRELVDLQTSTGTYIAEGFVSHNTTFIDLFILDSCVFVPNQTAGIIALTLDDVKKIFRRKIRYPYDRLPEQIKAKVYPTNDTQNEIVLSNKSEISVDTGFRGGTYNLLHVSEYGKISTEFPERATEIKVGSFNTVHPGNYIFVESTGHGKGGEFYDLTMMARQIARSGRPLTQLDFRYHFYPWWFHPNYVLPTEDAKRVVFTRKDTEYFARVEAIYKVQISLEQRAWYVITKQWNGAEMKREHPSTDDEPFEAVLKGALFAELMHKAREERRITRVRHDPGLAVDTWWDIGRRDKTAIWFVQMIGNELRFIWYYEDTFKGLPHYVDYCNKLRTENKWNYRHHLGPHDMAVTEWGTNKTRWETARNLGYLFAVGQQFDQKDQIDAARALIPMCLFDEENCSEGITHLEQVRREWNEHLQTYMDHYRHDEHSHGASAFMNGAMMLGRLTTPTARARPVENRRFAT